VSPGADPASREGTFVNRESLRSIAETLSTCDDAYVPAPPFLRESTRY
jgi:hypothetical protein